MPTEPLIRESPAFARAIVAAAKRANVAIVVRKGTGSSAQEVFVNDAAQRLLGREATPPGPLPLDADTVLALNEYLDRSAGPHPAPLRTSAMVSATGNNRRPVDLIATCTSVADERAQSFFFFDTAEQRHAERASLQSQIRFKRLLDAAPDAIAIGSPTRFMYANPAFVTQLGYANMTEALQVPLRDLVHPDDLDIVHRTVRATFRKEPRPMVQPLRIRKRDGRVFRIELRTMLTEWDGETAVLGIGRDVTEEHRVQSRLIHADRLAAVGTLAAGVAHEINNPLAYVLLNLQYLMRKLPRFDGRQEMLDALLERLEEARHGAQRVSTIVNDLRAFARSEPEKRGPVSLADAMRAAVKVAGAQVRRRAKLEELYEDRAIVDGSAARLEQVFVNLLVNAAQAIDEGRPSDNRVQVTVRSAGGRAIAEVADSGTGMAPDVRSRIFDPFFTTKPRGTGTGLGLPICHSIVTSFGGDIAVESTRGCGTRFTVTLPVTTGELPLPTPAPPPSTSLGWRGRLLVVDDEHSVAEMLQRTLSEQHEVTIATSAEEALGQIEKHVFDVVFCDLLMPKMDGIDLYAAIKKRAAGVERRLVFMTGGAFTERASRFLSTVPNRRIQKPFDLDEIERVLAELAPLGAR